MHADVLAQREVFSEVHCAFLKEEPFIQDSLSKINAEEIIIVPDFLAEGYFTRQVIPELLQMQSRSDQIRYCAPVGTHPMMQDLICESADNRLTGWNPSEVSLLLIGHGSTKNSRSKQTLLDHIEVLKLRTSFAQITDLWLEEAPFVSDWQEKAEHQQIIVIPFLLSDGQHGGWDIPDMLGLSNEGLHGVTHQVAGKEVRLAHALGSSPSFADVIESVAGRQL